jgi:hypothetical protein
MQQRAKRPVQPSLAATQEPLEDRVDKAGQRALARRNAKRWEKAKRLAKAKP